MPYLGPNSFMISAQTPIDNIQKPPFFGRNFFFARFRTKRKKGKLYPTAFLLALIKQGEILLWTQYTARNCPRKGPETLVTKGMGSAHHLTLLKQVETIVYEERREAKKKKEPKFFF